MTFITRIKAKINQRKLDKISKGIKANQIELDKLQKQVDMLKV